jgi:hypothetical protein
MLADRTTHGASVPDDDAGDDQDDDETRSEGGRAAAPHEDAGLTGVKLTRPLAARRCGRHGPAMTRRSFRRAGTSAEAATLRLCIKMLR